MKKIFITIFATLICAFNAQADIIKFVDENDEPLGGVTIANEKGGLVGTTGADGTIDISKSSAEYTAILFGMHSQTFTPGNGLKITMQADERSMEPITAVGYAPKKDTGPETVSAPEPKSEPTSESEPIVVQPPKLELTREDSEARIKALQENADEMRAKETSAANRLNTAAGMAATGIGLGEMMGGQAQVRADNDARIDMQAFVNSFTCDYGDGVRVAYGTVDEVLPGANILYQKYREYDILVQTLKRDKAELGLAPGAENEIVFDRSASPLYDDVSAGRTGGTYASLSRALLNPDGEDAARIAEQTDAARGRVRTGAITAGIGAVGSLVADQMINSPNAKGNNIFGRPVDVEDSRKINAHYDELRRDLREAVKPIVQASEATLATAPEVETDKEDGTINEAARLPQAADVVMSNLSKWEPTVYADETAVEPFETLFGESLFDSGKTVVNETGKTLLDKTISAMKSHIAELPDGTSYKVQIVAYTDSDGIKPGTALYRAVRDNQGLSDARAASVVDYMKDRGIENITPKGVGDTCARPPVATREQKAQDRKVAFFMAYDNEEFGSDFCAGQ